MMVDGGRTSADPRGARYPLGAAVTVEELDRDPHPALARLRAAEPVSYLPCLGAWLVTRRDLALAAMRDDATFTVDDPRFSTGRVVGPSMLSLDGPEHARHRAPFARPFRLERVRERFGTFTEAAVASLLAPLVPQGGADLRRAFTGPLAVRVMARALGLEGVDPVELLGWYDAIVAAVSGVSAGRPIAPSGTAAFVALRDSLLPVVRSGTPSTLLAAASVDGTLADDEVVANAAVLLFGGVETVDGMLANLALHVLSTPAAAARLRAAPDLLAVAVDESLRLEPAAAVVDRYAARDCVLGGAAIAAGDLVTVSLAGANRDPATFPEPDRFDLDRRDVRLHVTFAQGPHVCLGMHLARLEARAALAGLLALLPGLRLAPEAASAPRGLVFRKPPELSVEWDVA